MIKIALLAVIVCFVGCAYALPNFDADDLDDDEFDRLMAELEENGSKEFEEKYTIPTTTTQRTTTNIIFNEKLYSSIREARSSFIRASNYFDDIVLMKKNQVRKFFGYSSDESI
ncbi:hypothetical protein ACKWTF_005190 [Chironomus riparius]